MEEDLKYEITTNDIIDAIAAEVAAENNRRAESASQKGILLAESEKMKEPNFLRQTIRHVIGEIHITQEKELTAVCRKIDDLLKSNQTGIEQFQGFANIVSNGATRKIKNQIKNLSPRPKNSDKEALIDDIQSTPEDRIQERILKKGSRLRQPSEKKFLAQVEIYLDYLKDPNKFDKNELKKIKNWMNAMRRAKKNGTLSEERILDLNAINFPWESDLETRRKHTLALLGLRNRGE